MRKHLLLAGLVSAPALAGGFAVSEQDAAASGRSGTATAVTATASSVYFNPAGLATLEGVAATAGATAILPSATAQDPNSSDTAKAQGGLKIPPHVYAAYGFGRFTVGAGFNAPYGGGLKWNDDWRGRYELTEMSLQVLAGHLGGGFKINDQLSIGLTASIYSTSVALTKKVDFVDADGTAQLGGSGIGFGAAAGINWAPMPELKLGLMGKLPTYNKLNGRAHFESIPGAFQSTLPDQAISTELVLPGKLAIGADAKLPWFRLVADVELTFWSSFQTFAVDFEQAQTPDVKQERNWATAPTFRVGAERDFGKATFRAGAILDFAASPTNTLSPSLPDSTRVGFSLGGGYPLGPVRIDGAYQFISFLPVSSSGSAFSANYSANAHLIAISLAFVQARSEKTGALPPLASAQ